MSEEIYLRNLIRGLKHQRVRYLELADETSELISQAQERMPIIEYIVIKELPDLLKVGETVYEFDEGFVGKIKEGGQIDKELLKDFIKIKDS